MLKNNQPAAVRKANEKAKFEKYDLTFLSSMDVYLYYGPGQLLKNFKQEILVGLQKEIGS